MKGEKKLLIERVEEETGKRKELREANLFASEVGLDRDDARVLKTLEGRFCRA